MNYYERHLGDYAKDTGHLTMLEHGAYNLLLDRYYATESGIPADQAYRVARARSKEERDAVDVVLVEFFTLNAGVYVKKRCEEELERARAKITAARQNGRNGGRPRKTQQDPTGFSGEADLETQPKPTGLLLGSKTETQEKALQSPVSNLQTPDTSKNPESRDARASRLPDDWPLTDARRSIAKAEQLDPDRTYAKFTDYWRSASGANARKRDWDATWRNWCRTEADRKPRAVNGQPLAPRPTRFEQMQQVLKDAANGD